MARFLASSLTNFRHLVCIHRPSETLKISTLVPHNRMLVSRGMESRSSNRVIRARVVLGSVFILALPYYKKILRIEDEVEKDAEDVAEVVEAVAHVAEKIATDVAGAIPGDGRIKQLVVEAEHIAEEVAEDAEQVDAFIHKVDEITDEIEKLLETKEAELAVKESMEKVDTKPSKDPSI